MTSQMINTPSQPSGRIAPLHACLPPRTGPVRLMYDATLTRPLRLRDGEGVKLSPETHRDTLDRLARLDGLLQPLSIHYLGAELAGADPSGPDLDGARLAHLPRVLFAYAAAVEALQGVDLDLRPGVRVLTDRGPQDAVDAALRVRAGDTALTDPAIRAAVEDYGDWAARIWARAVGSTLGPWLLASGVSELRLAGTIRPDRRRQLDVLRGEPVDRQARP